MQLLAVSMETVHMAKSQPRKNQPEGQVYLEITLPCNKEDYFPYCANIPRALVVLQ